MWTDRQKDKQADMTNQLVAFQFLEMLLKMCYHSGVQSCVSYYKDKHINTTLVSNPCCKQNMCLHCVEELYSISFIQKQVL
jgi:hypothetical protein